MYRAFMYRALRLCLLPLATILLLAADPSWKARPVTEWDEQDAKQVLADSPWVKNVMLGRVRDLSVAQRREGGDWEAGIGKGVGIAGTGLLGPRREAEAIARAHAKPPLGTVMVRWESAFPIRSAEQKAAETDVPTVDPDHYAIAVYDVPTPNRWNLARELRGVAFLRRDHKKDLKPSSVRIVRNAGGTATLVYLFPRSVEISARDGRIAFVAQIGRLFVSQYFDTGEMQFQGKLEL